MADSYWSLDGFIDAFVASLQARPGLAGKQVEDSWPGEGQQPESVWVHEATSVEEVAGMRTGTINYNEDYRVVVVCDAYADGGTAKDARDLLTSLAGEVMAEVAENARYTTTDDKIVAIRVAGWKYYPYATKTGRGCWAEVTIRVSGRR